MFDKFDGLLPDPLDRMSSSTTALVALWKRIDDDREPVLTGLGLLVGVFRSGDLRECMNRLSELVLGVSSSVRGLSLLGLSIPVESCPLDLADLYSLSTELSIKDSRCSLDSTVFPS